MHEQIARHVEEVAAICREKHVRRLAIFGSALRDDFSPEKSDVDLIVEFEQQMPVSYFENYFSLLENLRNLFARNVDLLVWDSIRNPYFRKEVESTREIIYAA